MDFEIKTSPEVDSVSQQRIERPWWIKVLIIIGLLLVVWFGYSVVRGLISPDSPNIEFEDITDPLIIDEISSVVGRVISLTEEGIIISANAEINSLEQDTLITILLVESTKYYNHVTSSSEIVNSSKEEIALGDEVVAKGKGNVKGKTEFEAETLTIIVK
tara:strand:- start:888 stop:1367 length:480 start_codon:yes stop_codon:yes gene_type:complete